MQRGGAAEEARDGLEMRCVAFEHLLHDARAMPFFLDFLSQIEKVELLFFWLEVEEYKQLTGRTGDLLAQASKIYEKYFAPAAGSHGKLDQPKSAPDESDDEDQDTIFAEFKQFEDEYTPSAKLDFDLALERTKVRQQLEEGAPTLDMFSSAQRCVETVLRTTYFARFKASRSFQALLEELRNRRPISMHQILDNPEYAKYLSAFIQDHFTTQAGNLEFLIEANDRYRARALGAASSGASAGPRLAAMGDLPVALGAATPGRHSHSQPALGDQPTLGSPKSAENDPPRRKQLRARKSHSVFSFGRWESAGSVASAYQSDAPGASGHEAQRRDRFSPQRDQSRPSSFIDMLPVSAAPPSAAQQLKETRTELLELLAMAYDILDRFLSRSSSCEASKVSDDSKVFVSQSLEKISAELGGGSGKLASVGGFASISTAFSVLDSLANQLENVFVPAQKDVLAWMQEDVFPLFRDSECFAALMARIEEEASESHRERNLLNAVLAGKVRSSKLLVLELPAEAAPASPSESPNQQEGVQGAKARAAASRRARAIRDGIQIERRRRSSFLWNARGAQNGKSRAFVSRAVLLSSTLVADERPLRPYAPRGPTCECECHVDCSESACTCSCASPCLSHRAGGMLFRTRIDVDVSLMDGDASVATAESGGSDSQRSATGAAVRTAETRPEQAWSSSEALPPEIAAFMLPMGLAVRVADTEEIESESLTRLRLTHRTRRSSDPDNVNGFIATPAPPFGGPYPTVRVKTVINEHTAQVGADEIELEETDASKWAPPGALPEHRVAALTPDQIEAERRELVRKIETLRPRESVHCFVMPCRQRSQPSRPSTSRFWYGACLTRHQLVEVQCPTGGANASKPESTESLEAPRETECDPAGDHLHSASAASGYRQVEFTLCKHPDFGLGLNLHLNEHGYIIVREFVNRPDGSISPAARSGVLRANDALVAIDGVSVAKRMFEDVIKQIKQASAPMRFVFARGWAESLSKCSHCAKSVCLPTFAFVPVCLAVLSLDKPVFNELREVLDQMVECVPPMQTVPGQAVRVEPTGQRAATQPFDRGEETRIKAADTVREALARASKQGAGAATLSTRAVLGPPPVHFAFAHLFRFLRKENVADTVAALLLNRPVIMLSDSPTLLTFVGESLRTLLWPFVWKHPYCPLVPVPLCRSFAARRRRKLDETAHSQSEGGALASSFFIGICTLELGARDTHLGEFVGYEAIREWMVHENDNLRPYDRFMAIRALAPLLEGSTLVVDIDSDTIEVPRPSDSLVAEVSAQQLSGQGGDPFNGGYGLRTDRGRAPSQTPRGVEEVRRAAANRFSHPLFRYEEAVTTRRLRASSSSSASSFTSLGQSLGASYGPRSFVPSFPETLRDRLLEDWEGIPANARSASRVHGKLMRLHSSMLSAYREYFLTCRPASERARTVLSFNVRMFLLKCPRLYRPYLGVFLRTKSFAAFLVESVCTKCDFFSRRDLNGSEDQLMRPSEVLVLAGVDEGGLDARMLDSPAKRGRSGSKNVALALSEIPEVLDEVVFDASSGRGIQPRARSRSGSRGESRSPSPRPRRAASPERSLATAVRRAGLALGDEAVPENSATGGDVEVDPEEAVDRDAAPAQLESPAAGACGSERSANDDEDEDEDDSSAPGGEPGSGIGQEVGRDASLGDVVEAPTERDVMSIEPEQAVHVGQDAVPDSTQRVAAGQGLESDE